MPSLRRSCGIEFDAIALFDLDISMRFIKYITMYDRFMHMISIINNYN